MTRPRRSVAGAGADSSGLDASGSAEPRVDGLQKVTGGALYSADHAVQSVAYAVAFTSTVSSGRVTSIDTSASSQVPGVLLVITRQNAEKLKPLPPDFKGGRLGQSLLVLQDDSVQYAGQYLGLVVAETLEAATHAAMLVRIAYATAPALTMRAALRSAVREQPVAMITTGSLTDQKADSLHGDPDKALKAAAVKIVETYTTPIENHNPMEPSAVTAVWEPPRLTVYTSTQWVMGARAVFAQMFGLGLTNVHVISRFVGGGFGCKGSVWPHELLAVMAARAVKRPVKLVMTRPQMFAQVGHRPPTEQRISLGAKRDGTLTSVIHEVTSATSMFDSHAEPAAGRTPMLYACRNLRTSHRVVKAHVNTPTSMRAPGSAPGSCAFEAAMDELAFALGMDPIELRLRNYANADDTGKPFTSKALRECYQQGAARFGWRKKALTPGAIRDGNWLVGQGMATAVYPTNVSTASAAVRLQADGTAVVDSCTHDLGTGTATIMAQVAAAALGLPVAKVVVNIGDSSLPPAPVAGGSRSTASVCPAVDAAAADAVRRLAAIAVSDPASPLTGLKPADIVASQGKLVARSDATKGETFSSILRRHPSEVVMGTATVKPPQDLSKFSAHAFGAQFAEVRVDADLRIARVTRFVGAFGVGRVLNQLTARSQLMGGIIWGIGMALLEQTVHDDTSGAVINASLAEYLLPVNADVPEITILLVDEQDQHVNSLGVKGLGELGITGAGAAVANAIFHATGRRVRDLPITIEKLL